MALESCEGMYYREDTHRKWELSIFIKVSSSKRTYFTNKLVKLYEHLHTPADYLGLGIEAVSTKQLMPINLVKFNNDGE